MDSRSVLGVPAVWPSFLDNVPAAQSREGEARGGCQTSYGAGVVISDDEIFARAFARLVLDGDVDEDDDFDDDNEDEDDDDDEEDDEDEDVETWQVSVIDRRR